MKLLDIFNNEINKDDTLLFSMNGEWNLSIVTILKIENDILHLEHITGGYADNTTIATPVLNGTLMEGRTLIVRHNENDLLNEANSYMAKLHLSTYRKKELYNRKKT